MSGPGYIEVFGARQHNLKNIDVRIPRGQLTVITGVSGSGKSSLAFDTVFAEGQRRYVESLSVSARQYLDQLPKPDVDRIEGLSPTIAIEQRGSAANPRSTVATATEIYDFLRVLFTRVGEPRCWKCDRPIVRQSTAQVVDAVLSSPRGQRIMVLAPLVAEQRGHHKNVIEHMVKEGLVRARIDGQIITLEELPPLPAGRKHTIEAVVDRLTAKPEAAARLADSIELATRLADGRVIITAEESSGQWSDECYSSTLACPLHPEVRIEGASPQLFSFNSPAGACPTCHGLGNTMEFDPDLIVPDRNRTLAEGAIAAARRLGRGVSTTFGPLLEEFAGRFGVKESIPFRNIPEPLARILIHGTTDADAQCFGGPFVGVIPTLKRLWEQSGSESAKQKLYEFLAAAPCEACEGTRLRPEARCVRVLDRSITDLTRLSIAEAAAWFEGTSFKGEAAPIADPLVQAIRHRLEFLVEVGVEYLTLNRPASTLSGGEWQRIRLATQIGGGLSGICYVLDEPTIGLHPRDSRRLTAILRRLCAMGNTLIVVEHDEEVIAAADYMIEIGPEAGARGGHLVAQGTAVDVLASEHSLTARYLRGDLTIPVPDTHRRPDWGRCLVLSGVTANNLKSIDVRFPLGCFVCVTGVSGSGKSTLVSDVLLRALKRALDCGGPKPGPFKELRGSELVSKVVEVDQSPIGRTPRSNPATYVGAFSLIRELFAKTREAKVRGYGPNRFSFNVKGGRCDHCEGQGTKRVAMHFLPDVYVPCAECGGSRYNRETLEIRYRGKCVADVLNLSVEEAVVFFDAFSKLRAKLQALKDVGLGYLTLGQASNTLSGGEAQRIKLAAELHKTGEGHLVYVLDEPTTGLHLHDVRNLLGMLNRLVHGGHTVIVIEHNLEMIKSADWIIDLGPEAGEAGGHVVAHGTPEDVAQCPESHTGWFLRALA